MVRAYGAGESGAKYHRPLAWNVHLSRRYSNSLTVVPEEVVEDWWNRCSRYVYAAGIDPANPFAPKNPLASGAAVMIDVSFVSHFNNAVASDSVKLK